MISNDFFGRERDPSRVVETEIKKMVIVNRVHEEIYFNIPITVKIIASIARRLKIKFIIISFYVGESMCILGANRV